MAPGRHAAEKVEEAGPVYGGPRLRRLARRRRAWYLLAAVTVLVVLVAVLAGTGRDEQPESGPSEAAAPAPTGALELPVRAAFYQLGFPETENWATHDSPALGRYDSSDPQVLAAHVSQAKYAGLDAFISSWIRGRATAARLPLLLDAAAAHDFAVAAYYEREAQDDPSVAEIRADLEALPVEHPAYLRLGGRPVLFVANSGKDDCSLVDRWRAAAPGWYLSLKVFGDYSDCPSQPDSWHQYAPSSPYSTHETHHATVSPGYWKFDEDAPRLERDPSRFRADLLRGAEAGVDWQLVTSFNAWAQGSAVEPAEEWATPSGYGAYLDAMHEVFAETRSDPAGGHVPPPRPEDDVVVMAAGDIACHSTEGDGAADGTGTRSCAQGRVARQVLDGAPHAVLALGDLQYPEGSPDQFRRSYEVTWGPLKSMTYPTPGNHEWLTAGAEGYRDYFSSGTPPEVDEELGRYSFDLGAWHFLSFDSDCSKVGGCQPGSPEYEWLRADLAAHDGRPTVAFWHHPRWSSGPHGSLTTPIGALWELLVGDRDVQVALSGHDHHFERFAPMGSTGPAAGGLRQFVVGTGGKNHTCPSARAPGSEALDCTSFGALRLTLHPDGSYDWLFAAARGTGDFTDEGGQPRR